MQLDIAEEEYETYLQRCKFNIKKRWEEVKLYLHFLNDKDINKQDPHSGLSLFHLAVRFYDGREIDKDIMNLFIEKGAGVNTLDINANSPLHTAVYCKNKDLVQLLLQNDALCSSNNSLGYSPLKTALMRDTWEPEVEGCGHNQIAFFGMYNGPEYNIHEAAIAQMIFDAYHLENLHKVKPCTFLGLTKEKIFKECHEYRAISSAFFFAKNFDHIKDLTQLRTLKGNEKWNYAKKYLGQQMANPICSICKELAPVTRFEVICPFTK